MATISGYRGDTLNYTFSLKCGGSSFTVDGHDVIFTMKERESDSGCTFQASVYSGTINVDNLNGHKVCMTIPSSCSSSFKTGPNVYDIQALTIDDTGTYTLEKGTFCIYPDVTF